MESREQKSDIVAIYAKHASFVRRVLKQHPGLGNIRGGDDVAGTYEYLRREEPMLDAMPTETAAGWTLAGTMTPHANLYNYGLSISPRDGRGLILAEPKAYPNELNSLPAGVPADFETEAVECELEEYLVSQS